RPALPRLPSLPPRRSSDLAGPGPGAEGTAEPADPGTGVDSTASARAEEALAAVGDRVSTYPDLNRPEVFQQSGLGWVPWIAPVAEAELTETQREALIEAGRA